MPLPDIDFLIIGAAKCATTWLQRSLQRSPAFAMPDPELHYFSDEFARGTGWYAAQFAGLPAGAILGEKSNSYLTHPEAAARIKAALPGARLIVQMRDPVARAYSDYCMLLRRGTVSNDIASHLDPRMAAGGRFVDHGRYAFHLRRLYDLFPPEQILLLVYEDIGRDPKAQLERLARHVRHEGRLAPPLAERVKDREAAVVPLPLRRALKPLRPLLDPFRDSAALRRIRDVLARKVNYPPLTPALAARLRDHYADDIAEVESLLGRNLPEWSHGAPASHPLPPRRCSPQQAVQG